MRGRLLLLGAVSLAALTGCSALPGTAPVPATSIEPVPVYTMNALTAVMPVPRSPAPALKTTGTGWKAILTSLAGYGQWVLANPNPSRIDLVATPGCSMHDMLSRQAAAMFEGQAYLQPSAPTFGAVTSTSPARGTMVTLNVTASRAAETVVSSRNSTAVSTFGKLAPTDLRITLFRGTGKQWRFCTVVAVGNAKAPHGPSVPLL